MEELKDLFEFESLNDEAKKEYKIAVLKKKEKMLEADLEFIREINRLVQKSAEGKTVQEEISEIEETKKEEELLPSPAEEAKDGNSDENGNGKEKTETKTEKETKEAKESEEPKKK